MGAIGIIGMIGGDMKELPSPLRPAGHPRLSLEQKLMLVARRYRAAEKRRTQKDTAGSRRRHLCERALWLSRFVGFFSQRWARA